MKIKKSLLIAGVCSACLASCGEGQKTLTSGIHQANMDTTVRPGDDFYEFACGGWMKNNPLTAEYSRFGTFDKLIEDNHKQLNDLIEGIAASEHPAGSLEQKIGALYNCVMDSVAQNEMGTQPVQDDLTAIRNAEDKAALFAHAAKLYRKGVPGLFGFYIGADIKNSKQNILQVYQGGLTLGEKEYYLDNDAATTKIRDAYKAYVADMFELYGLGSSAECEKMMADVMRIETRMAHKVLNATQRRNPEATYHKMSYDSLCNEYSGIDWNVFFPAVGVEGVTELSVKQPIALREAEKIWAEESLEALKTYVSWALVDASGSFLSDTIRNRQFDFYGRAMSGKEEDRPRWKRAVSAVNSGLGEAVGRIYVEKYFPAAAKERMITLVENLRVALGERIKSVEWMSDTTKAVALEKLDAFRVKVGYPDRWLDYSALEIDNSYWANYCRCNAFETDHMIKTRLNQPVDPTEWLITPQTVNAYYNPTTNEICFPAGILQYPFFDMQADDAFNYGAIGVVIGHEMTHGFDDKGRQFDKNGNLTDWWQPADVERFEARAAVMKEYFDQINVLPDLKANGEFTLGENLADHGGLMVAFHAFKEATKNAPLSEQDGFTPEQRFFLAYSTVWAGNIRDEEIRKRTKSDPHSLGRWRVNGALPHIDAWYEAFGITESDSLFVPKEKRASIW